VQTLFSPAVTLMNRLRYPSKFLLLGLAVTTVVLLLLFSVVKTQNNDSEVAAHELSGVQMLSKVNLSVQ